MDRINGELIFLGFNTLISLMLESANFEPTNYVVEFDEEAEEVRICDQSGIPLKTESY